MKLFPLINLFYFILFSPWSGLLNARRNTGTRLTGDEVTPADVTVHSHLSVRHDGRPTGKVRKFSGAKFEVMLSKTWDDGKTFMFEVLKS